MSVERALDALRFNPRFMRNIARWEQLPARPPRYASFPEGLDARLTAALAARDIEQLYLHQAAAVSAGLRGEHTAIVTAAASGKTLCYNLPVLNRLLANPQDRALYLFPTKALAQDQLAELRTFLDFLHGGTALEAAAARSKRSKAPFPTAAAAMPRQESASSVVPLTAATYDGDTPSAQRGRIREGAQIILSNPDMLHTGILPQHTRWAEFFAHLRVVVIDEMHMYRGVFGSHIANVLRRLRRICRFYGSDPQFLLASATIANPQELAGRLAGAAVTVVGPELDGAPHGAQHILFYNPPVVDPALGIRRSSTQETAELAAHFLEHDVQTIVFARTRLATELIVTYARERSAELAAAIRGYRGGYLPLERRAIEQGLREGTVRGVVATNALELGIDIGQLDAALLAGYPGTVASSRQQMGRAGRRQGTSVGLLVAGAEPLDQYIVTHPNWLLSQSPEHARLNPDNEIILASHLLCAAAELPLRADDREFGSAQARAVLQELVAAGQLYEADGRHFWAGDGSPAINISLRSAEPEQVVIQTTDEAGRPQVIGELDRHSAPVFLYTGAIYLHEGVSYQVERLDWENGLAHVRRVAVDYYTRPVVGEGIEVLRVAEEREATPEQRAWGYIGAWGDVRVVRKASGYRILRRSTGEMLGFGPIDLPEQILDTQGCWLTLHEALIEKLKSSGAWLSAPNDYGPNWATQRAAVRQRDGYRCQNCGTPEMNGRQHDVHHKVPFRAFVAHEHLREGLPAELAWQVANRLPNLVTLCPSCHRLAEVAVRTRSGLGGVAALLTGVAPLFLMCDPRDLGIVPEPQSPTTGLPTITVYEHTPGGVGYAEQLFVSLPEILAAAHDLVNACPCENGCPACVGPVLEHEYMLDTKELTRALLAEMCVTPD